jgi:hypothetical protein
MTKDVLSLNDSAGGKFPCRFRVECQGQSLAFVVTNYELRGNLQTESLKGEQRKIIA